MSVNLTRLALWLLSILLLVVFAWSLNLTAFNWWASDVPPHQHRKIYNPRGNIFFAISLGFLLALVLTVWTLIRAESDDLQMSGDANFTFRPS
jgi:hypothetical protein